MAWSGTDSRRLLSRTLRGRGIELGPGENPFVLHYPGAESRSVDRWDAEDNRRLFREVKPDAFSDPHLRADLNVERLSGFADASLDFVIASHVLEHLVEPLGQLEDIHRVLVPGGVLLLLLPDRRRTFDRTRRPTSLEHLVAEYDAGVTELDDAHIEEFLAHVQDHWEAGDEPKDQAERFDRHRKRSIHVHVWSDEEFAQVIAHCIRHLGMQWELIDQICTHDLDDSHEFGFALRKSTVALDPDVAADHFLMASGDLFSRSRWPAHGLHEAPPLPVAEDADVAWLHAALTAAETELAQAKRVIANHERVLGPLRRLGGGTLARWFRR